MIGEIIIMVTKTSFERPEETFTYYVSTLWEEGKSDKLAK